VELEAIYGQAFTFMAPIISTTAAPSFLRAGSFSDGDFAIVRDGASNFSNVDATPVHIAGGAYIFSLTDTEMQAGEIMYKAQRDSNASFYDQSFLIRTRGPVDLSFRPQPGWVSDVIPSNFTNIGIESDGHVHGDLKEWLGVAPLALDAQRVDAIVGAVGVLNNLSTGDVRASVNSEFASVAPTGWSNMAIQGDGMVQSDLREWRGTAPLVLVSQRPQTDVRAVINSVQNEIADHVIRRQWGNVTDGDTEDDRSLLGVIAQGVNFVYSTGGNLVVYRDDDATSFAIKALTTSGVDDVVGVTPPA